VAERQSASIGNSSGRPNTGDTGGSAGRLGTSETAADVPWQLLLPWLFPWPFPWPPCTVADHCVGLPAPVNGSVQTSPPPESAGSDHEGIPGVLPQSPAFPGHPMQPGDPSVIDADGGTTAPVGTELSPLRLPPIMGGPTVFGGAAPIEAPVRGPSTPNSGPGPREIARSGEGSVGRERLPTSSGSGTYEVPASFRVGYPEYLREAKIGEVAIFALPGVLGILALTALGGFLGYRQAKASHVVRATGTARFLR